MALHEPKWPCMNPNDTKCPKQHQAPLLSPKRPVFPNTDPCGPTNWLWAQKPNPRECIRKYIPRDGIGQHIPSLGMVFVDTLPRVCIREYIPRAGIWQYCPPGRGRDVPEDIFRMGVSY